MAANTISNQVDDAQRAMQQAFGGLNAGATSLLQAFAKSHQDRAARLAAAEEALVKEVGATDPQVIELRTRKERSLQFAAGIQTALQRAQAVPQPFPPPVVERVELPPGHENEMPEQV